MAGRRFVPSEGALLEHAGFLRALSRSLLRDEHASEDVVQQTMLKALEGSPARPRNLRAWLGTVARNFALTRHRTLRRRRTRETRAARSERIPPPQELVAQLEVQRRVADAVLELDEPYRAVVVSRFYYDLSPREIARELELPVETVRTRLKRALHQLRASMDRLHHGDRRAWALALLPLFRFPKATSVVGAAGAHTGSLTGAVAMFSKAGVTIGTVVAVAMFGVGWMANPGEDSVRTPLDKSAGDGGGGGSRVAALQQQLDDAQRRNKKLADELDALKARKDGKTSMSPVDEVIVDPGVSGPRYLYGLHDEVMRKVDWAEVGESISEIAKRLEVLQKWLQEGGPPPPSVGEIQRWNGPLVKMALMLNNAGVTGTGVNGSYTHPTSVVNQVDSALVQAKLPLTAEQQKQLQEIGRRFSEAEKERTAAMAGKSKLEQLVAEAELKDRMYGELEKLLSDEQHELLRPETGRGRVQVDMFSTGLLWVQSARPMAFTSREQLAKQATLQANQFLGSTDPGTTTAVKQVMDEWVATMDPALLRGGSDKLSQKGLIKADRAKLAATEMARLHKLLADRVPLTQDQKARIRNSTTVFVPLPVARLPKPPSSSDGS